MSRLSEETVRNCLRHVVHRGSGRDVVSAGMISGVAVQEDKVGFMITIDAKDEDSKATLQKECEEAVMQLPGVASVRVVMTAHNAAPSPAARKPAVWNREPVAHVKKIIAVASGKGGVGKSTTAVNLAHAVAAQGKRAGLLDADIYGPSIPRMMALSGQPEIRGDKMIPLVNFGIQCNSMGFLTGDEAAIMRGPMISKTLAQLLRATAWENLDVLIVDMPPGTGDIHLSMAQQVPLDGALIVTTPQEVALLDARKCARMFEKVNVPILGVVENMSGSIFGSGGGAKLAAEFSVPLLASIAMDAAICQASDAGQASRSEEYAKIARVLLQQ